VGAGILTSGRASADIHCAGAHSYRPTDAINLVCEQEFLCRSGRGVAAAFRCAGPASHTGNVRRTVAEVVHCAPLPPPPPLLPLPLTDKRALLEYEVSSAYTGDTA